MPLFEVPRRANSKSDDLRIIGKSKVKNVSSKSIKGGLLGRINEIKAMVDKNLGQYKDDYIVIQDKEILHDYISDCIGTSYISVDTETTGLDPLLDKIVGVCINTYGQKGAYIPLNHISYVTGVKTDNQLDIDVVKREFDRLLKKKPDIDMFNACFDIRFMRNQANISDIYCTWDGYLASRLLNENEPQKGLKALHNKYCLDGKGDAFSFDALFKGVSFDKIPIQTAYLYAAHDPVITTELCEYQRQYLRPDSDRDDMRKVYWVFKNIEMPCVDVISKMEDNGILFDNNYASELSVKYHSLLNEKINDFYSELEKYKKEIETYKLKNPNHKLSDPINISSPTQLAILLYDILGIKSVDKKSPRGTGVEILTKLNNPIADAVLEYRKVEKLLSTYIDKLPNCVNPNDGRIHCKFNQYGADTGRMSSSDPNLQNIPSRNHDIRKMFIATNEIVEVTESDNSFIVDRWAEVETSDGWKCADKIIIGDKLVVTDDNTKLEIIVSKINTLVDKNQIVYYY